MLLVSMMYPDENLCPHKKRSMDVDQCFTQNCTNLESTKRSFRGELVTNCGIARKWNIIHGWQVVQPWENLNASYSVKELAQKRLHAIGFQWHILEKAQRLPRVKGRERWVEHSRCLGAEAPLAVTWGWHVSILTQRMPNSRRKSHHKLWVGWGWCALVDSSGGWEYRGLCLWWGREYMANLFCSLLLWT